jgi:hypothetical protein
MVSHSLRYTHRLLVAGLLAFGLLILVGCGPDYKARAVVKGKVTMGNKPLTSGTVVFYGPQGVTSTATIDENGNYTMNDAPVGDVTITVTVSVPPAMGPGGLKAEIERRKKPAGGDSKDPEGGSPGIAMSKMPTTFVRIDEKYSKPETSGLKYKVEKGEHVHNIEL